MPAFFTEGQGDFFLTLLYSPILSLRLQTKLSKIKLLYSKMTRSFLYKLEVKGEDFTANSVLKNFSKAGCSGSCLLSQHCGRPRGADHEIGNTRPA